MSINLSKTNVMVWAEEAAMAASKAAKAMGPASFGDGRITKHEKASAIAELERAAEKVSDSLVALEEEA